MTEGGGSCRAIGEREDAGRLRRDILASNKGGHTGQFGSSAPGRPSLDLVKSDWNKEETGLGWSNDRR